MPFFITRHNHRYNSFIVRPARAEVQSQAACGHDVHGHCAHCADIIKAANFMYAINQEPMTGTKMNKITVVKWFKDANPTLIQP